MEPIMKAEKQSNNQQVTETERHTDTAPKSIKVSYILGRDADGWRLQAYKPL